MDLKKDRDTITEKLDLGKELLYLTKKECENVGITRKRILELTKEALVAHGRKQYEMPAKIGVHPFEDVFFHAMPAYVPSQKAVGAKWIECYPRNPEEFGLPQTTGLLVMNDVLSGCPMAIMDSTWLTAMRTPAVTVLAAAALHPKAETFGMYGCGVQGIEHVRFVVNTLKQLKKIYVYDIRETAMDELLETVQPEIDVEIVKTTEPRQIAEKCDVMSSATVILKDPLSVVKKEWISPGQTILPCDLNTFWDPAIALEADQYLVDSIDEHQLFAEMGYFPDGLPRIAGETGEVLAGAHPGRAAEKELIVCSNIGMAVCDVVVGREIFDIALRENSGVKLPL